MPNAYALPTSYTNPYGTAQTVQNPYSTPAAPTAPSTASAPTAPSTASAARTPAAASAPSAPAAPATADANSTVNTMLTWVDKGWMDEDGKVTLPWGGKIPVGDAIKMYYGDNKYPTANEVPPWISMSAANEVTPTYWNQLPVSMRPFVQNLYDAARQSSSASRTQYPTVASMTPQAGYY